jgi:hypothetical protein
MAADLNPRKYAALDQAIDCRGVHAQYFGHLVDGKNPLEFVFSGPSPFHKLTTSDIATQIGLKRRDWHLPNGDTRRPATNALSQLFDNADVRPHLQRGNRCESGLESKTKQQCANRPWNTELTGFAISQNPSQLRIGMHRTEKTLLASLVAKLNDWLAGTDSVSKLNQ